MSAEGTRKAGWTGGKSRVFDVFINLILSGAFVIFAGLARARDLEGIRGRDLSNKRCVKRAILRNGHGVVLRYEARNNYFNDG